MKKCLIVFALCALLLVTYSLPVIIPNSDKDISISYFTKGNYGTNSIYLYDDIFMTTSDYKNGQKTADSLVNIVGISATFEGDFDDMQKVLKKCRVAVLSEESVGNVHIIYGISESCGKPVQANGMNINFQIAIRDNVITVGTPLIMGSY
ncbi:MAG TPA: hypothetical protein PLZ09_00840 [Clostridia bacterium]|nr:hypothetical protein [Clostridia bacterium]